PPSRSIAVVSLSLPTSLLLLVPPVTPLLPRRRCSFSLLPPSLLLPWSFSALSQLSLQEAEGKVVKLSQDSIHVVVLGFSSAIVTEKDFREEFVYKT
ncbi:hypothetical protein S245_060858, partial [Arachis hypogaea]